MRAKIVLPTCLKSNIKSTFWKSHCITDYVHGVLLARMSVSGACNADIVRPDDPRDATDLLARITGHGRTRTGHIMSEPGACAPSYVLDS